MNLDLLRDKILAGDREGIANLTNAFIREGVPAETIVNEHLIPAMDQVGALYESGEFFIPEMLMSARAMQAGMVILEPLLIGSEAKTAGKVVLGTVEGDMHEIGKTLVGIMLQSAGFAVHDLGVNVKPAQFVQAARDLKPIIVGMSALLTTTMQAMERTCVALKDAGLRDDVIVIVGGAPLTAEFATSIGADGYAEDAVSAVRRAKELIRVKRIDTA